MTTRRPITTIRTVITAISPAGHDVKLFALADPEGWDLPPFKPGGHIDLHLLDGQVRTYSLCNDPAERDRYLVAVKRDATGRGGSILLHDRIRIGQEIGVSLPRGGLDLTNPAISHEFVAGGIGVTPFLSAVAALQRAGRSDFTLHVVARGTPPLADLITPLVEAGRAVLHDTRTRARPDLAELVGPPRDDIAVACCGPPGMIEDFEKATTAWSPERLHIEYFVPPALPASPDARPYTLVLARTGMDIEVPEGHTILDALQAHGIDVPSSCGGGVCGACHVEWLAGRPIHRDWVLTPTQRERTLMACVAASADERLTLDL